MMYWRVALVALLSATGVTVPVAAAADAAASFGRVIVDSGVVPYQVFQRNADDQADFSMQGRALSTETGRLEYRILRRTQTVHGFDWQAVPVDAGGQWSADVKGLPVGGPFTIELRLSNARGDELDNRRIEHVLVGDLWVTAGQSNMDGCGELSGAEIPSERVHVLSLADEWQVAEDRMHYLYEAAYPVYRTGYVTRTERRAVAYKARGTWPQWPLSETTLGTSLGLTFAKEIESETGVPVGLILGSLGGTTIDQWSPDFRDKGGESMYGAMMLRIALAGGRVRGVLWYQGESDSSDGASATYKEKLLKLVSAIRSDLDDASVGFYTVQIGRQAIGRTDISPAEKNTVREAQRQAMLEADNAGLTTAIDLGLSSGAHIDTEGYKRVGRRTAKVVLATAYGKEEYETGPRLKAVRREGDKKSKVRVEFSNVNGRLVADGRVLGFSVRDARGAELPYVEAVIDPEQPDSVVIDAQRELPADAQLWYGYGWDPTCNVVDEADLAVPAFGPIAIP